jgi:nucleotide-binding universal stress UspA family protein/hemerythrin-like domain-containing protein
MFRHVLVPVDGSELSTETVTRAVEFALDVGAKITFLHVKADFGATGDGALLRTISPDVFAEEAAGDALAILSKADAAARAAGISYNSVVKTSDRPFEAIVDVANDSNCDLIFMASHGRRGVRGLMLGSQTQKVLKHTSVAVLVSSVESNAPLPSMNTVIAIIKDEHRSMAAVLHALRYLLKAAREQNGPSDFKLLNAILYYIAAFPAALHHPKEETYLFRKLRERTGTLDDVIDELQRQHDEGQQRLKVMQDTLARYQNAPEGGCNEFAEAVEHFAESQWQHMSLEEKVILPAAVQYLPPGDWRDIAEAFGKNGDPRLGAEPDEGFRKLFSTIMNLSGGVSSQPSVSS